MLQLSTLTSLAATLVFLHGLNALSVTSPSADSVWNLNQENTVTWTSVSTDPTSFNIVLVNQDASCAPTGFNQAVKENVTTSEEKYQISGLQGLKDCAGYQINLVSTTNGAILAQSAPFQISGSGQTTPLSSNATALANGTAALSGNLTSLPAANATNATQITIPAGNHSSLSGNGSSSSNVQNVSAQGHKTNGTTSGCFDLKASSFLSTSIAVSFVAVALMHM